MIEYTDIANVLFLDIECVTEHPTYDDLNDDFKNLWQIKSKSVLRKYEEEVTEEEAREVYPKRAAIYSEFVWIYW